MNMPHPPTRNNPARARRAAGRHRRGIVLVVTLLGIFLLAGLVMYVMNLGRHVNQRVRTQHGADAAAVSAGGWMARAFNTVALNNVAISHLVPLVAVLDAMPRASADTLTDQEALLEVLEDQLRRGVRDRWVREPLERARTAVAGEVQELRTLNNLMDNLDVRELTFYEGPNGRGRFWQAMAALDEYSQLTMSQLQIVRQLAATRGGAANLGDPEAIALALPARPQIPWQRGRFDDFEAPVRQGRLPPGSDDPHTNRGPYDTVFGWRSAVGGEVEGYYRDNNVAGGGGGGSVPVGRGAGGGGGFVVTSREPDSYTTRGTLSWILGRVGGFSNSTLPYSRFSSHVSALARTKLHQLWPTDPAPAASRIEPDWETDFDEAVRIGDNEPGRIRQTAFVAVEVKSRYPASAPQFLTPGSWAYVENNMPEAARMIRTGGWEDPRQWPVPKIQDELWRDEWSYEVFFDNQIGITRQTNAAGNPVPQPVYRVDTFMFAGVNLGDSAPIRNPYNVGARDALPAPLDFDHDTFGAGNQAAHDAHLRVLGLAERPHRPLLWSRRFGGGAGHPGHVGIAAARVFNDHSWDLWTQMWHARLEPVGRYDRWIQVIQQAEAEAIPELDTDRFDRLRNFLASLSDLAPETLRH